MEMCHGKRQNSTVTRGIHADFRKSACVLTTEHRCTAGRLYTLCCSSTLMYLTEGLTGNMFLILKYFLECYKIKLCKFAFSTKLPCPYSRIIAM